MLTILKIRRDETGSTEEIEADVTVTDSAVNIHLKEPIQLLERDVLILPIEAVNASD